MATNKNIFHLDRISKKDNIEITKEVSNTLLLLESNENSEEIKILREIGLDSHIRKAEEVKRDMTRFEVLEKKFGRKVYSGDQIREYCYKFGFRAIRVDKFKDEIPLEVGKALIDFVKENERQVELNEDRKVFKSDVNLVTSSFFLLVPVYCLDGAPIDSATLFYREDYTKDNDNYERLSNKNMLVEVYSWGDPKQSTNQLIYFILQHPLMWIPLLLFVIMGLCTIFKGNACEITAFFYVVSFIMIVVSSNERYKKWN